MQPVTPGCSPRGLQLQSAALAPRSRALVRLRDLRQGGRRLTLAPAWAAAFANLTLAWRCRHGHQPRRASTSTAAGGSEVLHSGSLQVQELTGKGMSAVAKRAIRKGELILREQPILCVPAVRQAQQLEQWDESLRVSLELCSAEQQARFWELSDAHAHPGEPKSAAGIVRTNGLPIQTEDGSDLVGIYPTVSRFNHSCNSNVNNSWQPVASGHGEVLHALRDIEAGEELCIAYIDLFATRDDRRTELHRTFKFLCSCEACSRTGEMREHSDCMRLRLRQLRDALPSTVEHGLTSRVVGKMGELIDLELGGNPAAKAYVNYLGYELLRGSQNHEDRRRAREFARSALQQAVIAEGTESWLSRMLKTCTGDE